VSRLIDHLRGHGEQVAVLTDTQQLSYRKLAAAVAGVPVGALQAVTVPELPMLPSGKPDYQAVRALAGASKADTPNVIGLRKLFADVLQIDADSIDDDASFVDLGGNSLSYVPISVRLERALGQLPADWQRLLQAMPKPASRLERLVVECREFGVLRADLVDTRVAYRSAMSPSCTIVAAIAPSDRTRLAVTTPRPRAAAGERDSSRFHSSARTRR
jgi:phosphopantetheine binding protein